MFLFFCATNKYFYFNGNAADLLIGSICVTWFPAHQVSNDLVPVADSKKQDVCQFGLATIWCYIMNNHAKHPRYVSCPQYVLPHCFYFSMLVMRCSNKTFGDKRALLFTDEDDPHRGDNHLTVRSDISCVLLFCSIYLKLKSFQFHTIAVIVDVSYWLATWLDQPSYATKPKLAKWFSIAVIIVNSPAVQIIQFEVTFCSYSPTHSYSLQLITLVGKTKFINCYACLCVYGLWIKLKRKAAAKATDLKALFIDLELIHLKRDGKQFQMDKFYSAILYEDLESDGIVHPDACDKFEDLLSRWIHSLIISCYFVLYVYDPGVVCCNSFARTCIILCVDNDRFPFMHAATLCYFVVECLRKSISDEL